MASNSEQEQVTLMNWDGELLPLEVNGDSLLKALFDAAAETWGKRDYTLMCKGTQVRLNPGTKPLVSVTNSSGSISTSPISSFVQPGFTVHVLRTEVPADYSHAKRRTESDTSSNKRAKVGICPTCREQVQCGNLAEHSRTCPIVVCDSCKLRVPRDPYDLSARHGAGCVKEPLQCPGLLLGCNWVGLSQDLQPHQTACVYASLAPRFQSQAAEIASLKKKVADLTLPINITVVLSSGDSFPVRASPQTTMWRIKEALQVRSGMSFENHALLVDGTRVLNENLTLANCKVRNGDILDLLPVQIGD